MCRFLETNRGETVVGDRSIKANCFCNEANPVQIARRIVLDHVTESLWLSVVAGEPNGRGTVDVASARLRGSRSLWSKSENKQSAQRIRTI